MKTPRILVVDDYPGNVDLVKINLADLVRVDGAMTGQKALAMYAEAKTARDDYDLLLLDLAMPDKSGFEIAEEIRAKGDKTTKIVFFTAHVKSSDAARAAKSQIIATWDKSVTRDVLRSKITDLLGIKVKEPQPDSLLEETVLNRAIDRRRNRSMELRVNILIGICLSLVGFQLFSMWRFPILVSYIKSMGRPSGSNSYRLTVSPSKSNHYSYKDGREMIGVVFEAKDAAEAQKLKQMQSFTVTVSGEK